MLASKLLKLSSFIKINTVILFSKKGIGEYVNQEIEKSNDKSNDSGSFINSNNENISLAKLNKLYEEELFELDKFHDYDEFSDNTNKTVTIESLKEEISKISLNDLHNVPNEIFNIGPLITRNETLTNLLDFGVDLYIMETRKESVNILPRLHWVKDVIPMILFLKEQANFSNDQLARVFSYHPKIFRTPYQEIESLINYFKGRNLLSTEIANVISERPSVFGDSVDSISSKFMELENMINLRTDEMNSMIIAKPQLVVHPRSLIMISLAKLRRSIRFQLQEIKTMILKEPGLLIVDVDRLTRNFTFLNRELNMTYEEIVQYPNALTAQVYDLESRVRYLLSINRYQTDPSKELYTPIGTILNGDDFEFCKNVANTTVEKLWKFLKTM